MLNPEVINERLREIDENLKILEELRKTDRENFLKEPKVYKLAERCLEVSIQALLDICHYLIANNQWTKPTTNKEAIEVVARNNVIPEEFAKRILPLAGLRNILIHEYIKIDPKRLYVQLQNLADFREFQRYVIAYLKDS